MSLRFLISSEFCFDWYDLEANSLKTIECSITIFGSDSGNFFYHNRGPGDGKIFL